MSLRNGVVVFLAVVVPFLAIALLWKKPAATATTAAGGSMSRASMALLAAGTVALIYVALWSYRRYVSVPYNANLEHQAEGAANSGTANVMVFTADWCPACRRVAAPLAEFRKKYEGGRNNKNSENSENSNKVIVTTVDCSDLEETGDAAAIRKKYEVSRFPTVIMVYAGNVIQFEGPITLPNLTEFVDTMAK